MRSSRSSLIASSDGDSPEALGLGLHQHLTGAAARSTNAARERRDSEGTGGGGSSGWGSGALEEWEEAELAALSPESQKRERRRIANRDCARRIRQRKTELLAELTASVAALQADNNRLLATLTEVTRCWRDTTLENCELRSQLALLQAGEGSAGGSSGGSSGSDSPGDLLASPGELGRQLLSPGWLSPMAL